MGKSLPMVSARIPDEMNWAVKMAAASRRMTVQEFFLRALKNEINRSMEDTEQAA